MSDRNLVMGLVLIAISLAFGRQAMRYPTGDLGHMGPALFPLMVSGLLLLIGMVTVVRSHFVERVRLDFQVKNIAVMVFCASFAGTSYSVVRNLKIAAGLIAVAFAFQKLLGFNLPLY